VAATKIRFCWITAHDDRTEHAVPDDAQPAGAGVFEGLCGLDFLAASMDIGPDRRCPGCSALIRARNTIRDLDQRMPRRRWRSRLRCVGRSRGRHAA
jgi:hypothetical protein